MFLRERERERRKEEGGRERRGRQIDRLKQTEKERGQIKFHLSM